MNTTLPVETETPPGPALNLSIIAEEKITATPTEQIRPLLMAAPKEVAHPCIWNVSMIEGDGNYTSLLEIPVDEIGDGDTIRIWGVASHPYNGGIVIDKPNVTVTRWEGSPAQPLITNTTGEAPAFTVTADNAIFRGLNISDNHLNGNGVNGNGAGIYATRNSEDHILGLTITDCTFTGNTVAESGGALYVGSVDKVLVEGTRFAGNTAGGGGGALFGGCDNATLSDTSFTDNTAGDGGGAWFEECENATLTGTSFTDNTAGDGGGAWFGGCENVTLTDAAFTGNTAEYGGGAWFNGCESATLTGTSFAGNAAGIGGGAWFVECENATLTGMTFENNRAEFLSDSGPKATFSRIDFEPETVVCGSEFRTMATINGDNGESESYGGGAWFGGCDNATLSDTSFTDNTATYYGGGAWFGGCENATLTGTSFTGNTAEVCGGAYFVVCENATLTGATFTDNTAEVCSGGGLRGAIMRC